MTQPPAGKREQGKLERKERLYEAALTLFRAQGYEATTVEQITRQAGLAKGTFFNYFPTKDAVLRYLGRRETGRLGTATIASGDGQHSTVSGLKRLLSALGESLEKDHDLIRLIFQQGISVSNLMAGDAGGFSIQPTAALLIRQAQRRGEIKPELNPDMLAATLDALYLQQLARWAAEAQAYPLAERLTGIVDLLMIGMRANRDAGKCVERCGIIGLMQRLISGAAQMGLNLLPTQVAAFNAYTDELLAWNERFNLTAVTDREQVEIRHYLDSLALLPVLAALEGVSLTTLMSRNIRAVDVGAGAGLPGLALRIVWPRLRLSLIEATGKKVRFMEHLAGLLSLGDVQLIQGRAEELALREPHRAGYDLVVARAVATLPTLVEYLLPLARRGGSGGGL